MSPKHYEAVLSAAKKAQLKGELATGFYGVIWSTSEERWEPTGGSYCPLSAYVMENHIPAYGDSVSTTCQKQFDVIMDDITSFTDGIDGNCDDLVSSQEYYKAGKRMRKELGLA